MQRGTPAPGQIPAETGFDGAGGVGLIKFIHRRACQMPNDARWYMPGRKPLFSSAGRATVRTNNRLRYFAYIIWFLALDHDLWSHRCTPVTPAFGIYIQNVNLATTSTNDLLHGTGRVLSASPLIRVTKFFFRQFLHPLPTACVLLDINQPTADRHHRSRAI
jgi:hypothetical protein